MINVINLPSSTFQSTSPVYRGQNYQLTPLISKHECFNPLAPFIEARTKHTDKQKVIKMFQSTSPVYRGQNKFNKKTKPFSLVSIHQPRLQRLELRIETGIVILEGFNPLAPFIEARTNLICLLNALCIVSIHQPRLQRLERFNSRS